MLGDGFMVYGQHRKHLRLTDDALCIPDRLLRGDHNAQACLGQMVEREHGHFS